MCRTAQVPKKTKFAQFMFAGGDNSDEGGEDSGWTKRVKDPRAQARNAATAKREAAARKKPRGGAPPKKKRRGAFAGESESSDDDDDDMNGFIKEDDEESTPRAGRAFAMPVVAACEERDLPTPRRSGRNGLRLSPNEVARRSSDDELSLPSDDDPEPANDLKSKLDARAAAAREKKARGHARRPPPAQRTPSVVIDIDADDEAPSPDGGNPGRVIRTFARAPSRRVWRASSAASRTVARACQT